jgi:hypothetical protein
MCALRKGLAIYWFLHHGSTGPRKDTLPSWGLFLDMDGR